MPPVGFENPGVSFNFLWVEVPRYRYMLQVHVPHGIFFRFVAGEIRRERNEEKKSTLCICNVIVTCRTYLLLL